MKEIIIILLLVFSFIVIEDAMSGVWKRGYFDDCEVVYYDIIYPVFDNISYEQMYDFIMSDDTNTRAYDFHEFNCVDFSKTVIANAHIQNYMCGYVIVEGKGISHAIVAFDTTDGIFFVEPQDDLILTQEAFEEMIESGVWEPLEYAINGKKGWDTISLTRPTGNYTINWYSLVDFDYFGGEPDVLTHHEPVYKELW